MKWEEYIDRILAEKTAFDELSLSIAGEAMSISPIVKVSVLMLESELQSGSRHNVFIFPNTSDLVYEFLIAKTIYNITVGKIKYSYDPHLFKPGQKLKYKNCVVVFEKCEIDRNDHRERICVSFSDGTKSYLPIEIAPVFQLADSKRVSTYVSFKKNYDLYTAVEEAKSLKMPKVSEILSKYKTHLDGSIFFVSTLKNSKEFLYKCGIDGSPISDSFFIGQVNCDGKVSNVFPGQMKGNPAIIIAPDLYYVVEAINQGVATQSIIINLTDSKILETQLDALDELSEMDFPIACICDTNSSFEMHYLQARDYSVWRWDSTNILNKLQQSSSHKTSTTLKNCTKLDVSYIQVDNDKLSPCIDGLNKYNNHILEMQNEVIFVHERLLSLSIGMLRSVCPNDFEEKAIEDLLKCIEKLDSAKKFINKDTYNDLNTIIATLDNCITHRFSNPKYIKLKEIIASEQFQDICVVLPNRFDKTKISNYWTQYVEKKDIPVNIVIMYPEEYCMADVEAEVTIITGWLGRKHMKNLLYSYKTEHVIVLEYDCEKRWANSHRRNFKKTLNTSGNSDVIKKYIKQEIETSLLLEEIDSTPAEPVEDDIEQMELFIRENRYRQYNSSGAHEREIDAIPFSFIGGYISFFGLKHSVISVTKIITQESDRIEIIKKPEQLNIGDFIAIREADRDIISEIADQMLENSGKAHLHKIARRWKDALELEAVFSPEEEIYRKIKAAGCKRSDATIHNWINNNDDYIAPSNKEDLICIAQATADSVLLETIDEVYDAAQFIKGTHQSAGVYLSKIVKERISVELSDLKGIDTFNIWDPIELDIENVGKIKILKVIDKGESVRISSNIVNRLIEE